MSLQSDGGPAFPSNFDPEGENGQIQHANKGMSLRDWLAGQALPALIARHRADVPWDKIPSISYTIADAFLAARETHDDRQPATAPFDLEIEAQRLANVGCGCRNDKEAEACPNMRGHCRKQEMEIAKTLQALAAQRNHDQGTGRTTIPLNCAPTTSSPTASSRDTAHD